MASFRPIGFSTGALALGDLPRALELLREHPSVTAVELSALRYDELPVLLALLPSLDLRQFTHISVHAPSAFTQMQEADVLAQLHSQAYPIVVHPNVLYTVAEWRKFGDRLRIENMDNRKPLGQTAADLRRIFQLFPEARFCFDVGHARQIDPSMGEAQRFLDLCGDRLAEIHISEVNEASRHLPLSPAAIQDFFQLAIPDNIPAIIESQLDQRPHLASQELTNARDALRHPTQPFSLNR